MPTKFQEKTATMRFFRDLHDRSHMYRKQFNASYGLDDDELAESATDCGDAPPAGAAARRRRRRDLGTSYLYDIRREVQHNMKDEANRNLMYNISKFLLDCRVELADRAELQRVRMETPDAGDILRATEDIERVMSFFLVKRPLLRRRQARQEKERDSSRRQSSLPLTEPFTDNRSLSSATHATDVVCSLETGPKLQPPLARVGDFILKKVENSSCAQLFALGSVAQGNSTLMNGSETTQSLLDEQSSPARNSNANEEEADDFAIGIDRDTFVDVFGRILAAEQARIAPASQQESEPASSLQRAASNASSPTKQILRRLESRRLSTIGGRSERRALVKLFDAMDVDDCGIVTWDQMIDFIARSRLSGEEVLEEQREGKLMVSERHGAPAGAAGALSFPSPEQASAPRVGMGTNIAAGVVTYIPDAHLIFVVSQTTVDGTTSVQILDVFAASDWRLLHRREVPLPTTAVVFIPGGEESGNHFGLFTSGGTFQLLRVQPQAARGGFELSAPFGSIQVPHAPAYAVFHRVTRRVYGASLTGKLFAYDASLLLKPHRIHNPHCCHDVFTEPITTLSQSSNGEMLFLSCLFGGVAVYNVFKGFVTHQYVAAVGGEPVSIRTMAYLEAANLIVTGGKSEVLHLWMSAPNKNVDPLVGSLRHESDPHVADIVAVWSEGSISPNVVVSLDRRGTVKLWDMRQYLCLSTQRFTDGFGYRIAHAAPGPRGVLYCLQNSAKTHRCLLDCIVLGRKLVNPVAVASSDATVHHVAVILAADEESAVSAIDGTIATYDLKTGKMSRFLPSVCCTEASNAEEADEGSTHSGVVSESITAMAAFGSKKVVVGTNRGNVRSFGIANGEPSASFQSLRGEVAGVVVLSKQRLVVAISVSDPRVHMFHIPERVAEADLAKRFPPVALVPIPDDCGASALCQRWSWSSTDIVAFWDTLGRMHQLTLETPRFVLSSDNTTNSSHHSAPPVRTPTHSGAVVTPDEPEGVGIAVANVAAITQQLSTTEVNYLTEKSVFRMLEDGSESSVVDIRCCTDLHPLELVASADSASHLQLWSTVPRELCKVKEWEHFSSRHVVASVNKSNVSGMYYEQDNQRLVTADDHGCVCVWDMQHVASAWAAVSTLSGAATDASGSETVSVRRQGFHSGEVERMVAALANVEIPLLNCFCVTSNEALISVVRMATCEAYCVGLARGSTRFVSMSGSVVGELFPDPKYTMTEPPRFFLHSIAEVEDMKKPRQRTRAGELWSKLRGSVLGEAKVMAMSVKELLARARNTSDLAEGDDLVQSDDESCGGSKAASGHKPFTCWRTPPNTPSKVEALQCFARVGASDRLERPELLIRTTVSTKHHNANATARRTFRDSVSSVGVVSDDDDEEDDDENLPPARSASTKRHGDDDDGVGHGNNKTTSSKQHPAPPKSTSELLQSVAAAITALCVLEHPGTAATSAAVALCVAPPPVLFPPSVFKALVQREPTLAAPCDLPCDTPQWIHAAIARPLPETLTASSVAQQVPDLVELDLPNPLLLKYWKMEGEDGEVVVLATSALQHSLSIKHWAATCNSARSDCESSECK